MNVHKNARLTPRGREWIVELAAGGQTPKAIAQAVGVCPRTVRKWLKRYESEGLAGLQDRSSRPRRLRRPTPQPTVERIEALRRQRLTGKAIATELGVSAATVSRILRRLGLNRLSALEPEPVHRYERENPGELIHGSLRQMGPVDSKGAPPPRGPRHQDRREGCAAKARSDRCTSCGVRPKERHSSERMRGVTCSTIRMA